MAEYIDITTASGDSFAAYLATPPSGTGPGLVLLQEIFGVNDYMREMAQLFAQEGYTVLVPDMFWRSGERIELGYGPQDVQRGLQLRAELRDEDAVADLAATITALRALPAQRGGVGVVGYCMGGYFAYLAATRLDVEAAVSYYGVGVHERLDEATKVHIPMALHLAELDTFCQEKDRQAIHDAFADNDMVRVYDYDGVDHAFSTTGRDSFDAVASDLAYARTLLELRGTIGPRYDLNAIWDNHIYHEFETRDVPATMATMIPDPYVNHIPTLTGGVGHDDLSRFYAHHFVTTNPPDTKTITLSRTVGANRIVEEQLLCFTHTTQMDWILPDVPPTGRYVEVPLVAIVTIRGDKLCNEHIYWDQASVLIQIGLLDPTGLPVTGSEQAKKLVDKTLPSNELMTRWERTSGQPVS